MVNFKRPRLVSLSPGQNHHSDFDGLKSPIYRIILPDSSLASRLLGISRVPGLSLLNLLGNHWLGVLHASTDNAGILQLIATLDH